MDRKLTAADEEEMIENLDLLANMDALEDSTQWDELEALQSADDENPEEQEEDSP